MTEPTGSIPGISAEKEAERRSRIERTAPELLAACKWFIHQIETGVLVRDISRDHEASWAAEMVTFTRGLHLAITAVRKAENG
jgi:hypothetical protein